MTAILRRNILLLALLLSLSGCGFQLRGDFNPPATAMPIHIVAEKAPYIATALKNSLEDQGIELFDRSACVKLKPAAACVPQTRIFLRHEELRQRNLSISSITQRLQEVELHYSVEMELRDKQDHILMPPRRFEFQRDFSYDESAPLATAAEAEYLREELRHDMLTTLIRTVRVVLTADAEK
jgi:LPS-assembly lipoprotein